MMHASGLVNELNEQLLPRYEEIRDALKYAIREFRKKYTTKDTAIILPGLSDIHQNIYIARGGIIGGGNPYGRGTIYSDEMFLDTILGKKSPENIIKTTRNFERIMRVLEEAKKYIETGTTPPAYSPAKIKTPKSFIMKEGPVRLITGTTVRDGEGQNFLELENI